jgi:hypothetical protein
MTGYTCEGIWFIFLIIRTEYFISRNVPMCTFMFFDSLALIHTNEFLQQGVRRPQKFRSYKFYLDNKSVVNFQRELNSKQQ